MGWLKRGLKQGAVNRMGINPAQYQFISWGNQRDGQGLSELWHKNIRENIAHWDAHPTEFAGTLKDLPDHENDCIIFVGASPILKRSVKYLKNLDPRFKIVATNSSIKYLVDHGVIPHYCVLLDGNVGKWTPEWIEIREKCKDVVGLFAVAAAPDAIKEWGGKFIVIPYRYEDKEIRKLVEHRYGRRYPVSGGNGFSSAIALFVQFTKATMFLLVGNELSFKKNYYVHGKAISDGKPCYFATDVFGKKVRTLSPLYEYKIWLDNFIQCLAGTHYFCNCSEGILGVESDGTFMQRLDQKALPVAIRDIMEAWHVEAMPSREKAKYIYTQLYKSGSYVPTLGAIYWADQFKESNRALLGKDEIKTVLDFGCGTGDGIRVLRDLGLEAQGVDIAEAHELWDERGVLEYCQSYDGETLPFPDNSFDMVGSFEVMEHIVPEDCEQLLREMFRVGKKFFVMTIALNTEVCPVEGILYTHCNLQSVEWWVALFKKVGFNVVAAEPLVYHHADSEDKRTLFVYAAKGETDLRVYTEPLSKTV